MNASQHFVFFSHSTFDDSPASHRVSHHAPMVAMEVVTPLALPVVVASAHGFTDLARRPRALLPYGAVAVAAPAVPSALVTAAFVVASWRHFAHDVTPRGSAALHASLALCYALGAPEVAWTLGAAYYCGVHAPLHVVRTVRRRRARVALRAALPLWVALCAAPAIDGFVLSDAMQLLVVAHVPTDECDDEKI